MRFDKRDKVVKAPDGLKNPLYSLTKAVVRAEPCGDQRRSAWQSGGKRMQRALNGSKSSPGIKEFRGTSILRNKAQ